MLPLRVRPRPWIGVAAAVGYVVLVGVVQRITGVPYPALGDSASTLFRGAGVPLLIGAVLLAITTTALGWWRPALRETTPPQHRWPILVPALLGAIVVVNLTAVDWPAYGWDFFGASVVLLLVGFTEELVARGLLLTALRSRCSEGRVWFLSSLGFALMHLVNVLAGLPLEVTVLQAANAFLFGTALYVLRRTTGTLIWSMVLHGFWDFSLFALGRGTPAPWGDLAGGELVVGLAGLIVVRWAIRGRTTA